MKYLFCVMTCLVTIVAHADEPPRGVKFGKAAGGAGILAPAIVGVGAAGEARSNYTVTDVHTSQIGTVTSRGNMAQGKAEIQVGLTDVSPHQIFVLDLKAGPGIFEAKSDDKGRTVVTSDALPIGVHLEANSLPERVVATAQAQYEATRTQVDGSFRQAVPDAPSTPGARFKSVLGVEAGAEKLKGDLQPFAVFRVGRSIAACGSLGAGDTKYLCADLGLTLGVGTNFIANAYAGVTYNHKINDSMGEKTYFFVGPEADFTKVKSFISGNEAEAGRAMFTIGIKAF